MEFKNHLKKKGICVSQFLRNNKWVFLRIGLLILPAAVGHASTASQITITPLQKPMEVIVGTLTGPIPKLFTGASVAMAGISWGTGMDQQITKRSVGCIGGGSIAMGAGEALKALTDVDVSACLF